MRFHSLELRYFGSFYHRARIDFDQLGKDGMFLIYGDTGAGKSTILDGIMFAFFGKVANSREGSSDERLLSTLRENDTELPEVTLVFSTRVESGVLKYYRIQRELSLTTKSDGRTGHTSSIRLQESENLDFHGAPKARLVTQKYLGTLVKLASEQFEQVVLLPQGKVQQFITSSSAERAEILEQLFNASIYNEVLVLAKEKLAQVDREYTKHYSSQGDRIRQLLRLMAETPVSATQEEDWARLLSQLQPFAAEQATELTVATIQAEAVTATNLLKQSAHKYQEEAVVAQQQAIQAQQTLGAATQQAEIIQQARAWADALQKEQGLRKQMQALELANQQALLAAPVMKTAQEEQQQESIARHSLSAITECFDDILIADVTQAEFSDRIKQAGTFDLPRLLSDSAARDTLDELVKDLRESIRNRQQSLRQVVELLADRDDEETKCRVTQEALATNKVAQETAQAQLISAQDKKTRTEEALAQAKELAAKVDSFAAAIARLSATAQTLEELHQKEKDCTAAQATLSEISKALQESAQKESLAESGWIASTAPTLAQTLQKGCPCPVCGAREHPHPAQSSASTITEEEFRKARQLHAMRLQEFQEQDTVVKQLQAEKQLLLQTVGQIEEKSLAAGLRQAQSDLDQAKHAQHSVPELNQSYQESLRDYEEQQKLLAALLEEQAALQSALEHHSQNLDKIDVRLKSALPEVTGQIEAQAMVTANQSAIDLSGKLEDTMNAWHGNFSTYLAKYTELTQALKHGGFDSVQDAATIAKPADALLADQEKVSQHQEKLRTLTANLKLEQYRGKAKLELPDLDALAAVADKAQEQYQELAHLTARLESSVLMQNELLDGISQAEKDWQKRMQDVAVLRSLSLKLEGYASPDRINLTRYYLARQLSVVVEYANDFLRDFELGKYRIAATNEDSDSQAKSIKGLGLAMYDKLRGTALSPKSMSGGEKFIISLAMTMGLSAAVQSTHGDISLENIFIDEGLGTLDDKIRDKALSALEQICQTGAGRSVGLISHVSAVRNQIPLQLEVTNYGGGNGTLNPDGASYKKGSYLQMHGVDDGDIH